MTVTKSSAELTERGSKSVSSHPTGHNLRRPPQRVHKMTLQVEFGK
jgi:hypothetical protein